MVASDPASTTGVAHPRESRFPGFDGLRAIAALAVFLTHVADTGGANAPNLLGIFYARFDGGVAIFFVLSGVLLYRPFARAHLLAESRPSTGPYLWRRALRIYPAYWLATTVVVVVMGNTHFASLRAALLDYSLLHIYSPHQADVFAPLVQSWTLATEVAFYLFLPVWSLVMGRIVRGPIERRIRTELIGTAALIGVSACWKAFVLGAGFSDARVGQLKMWLPWWLDLFAIGMALAVLALAVEHAGWRPPLRLDRRLAPMLCWLGALGTLWWVAAGAGLPHTTGTIARHLLWGQHYLYGLTALLLILPAVFGPQDRTSSRIRGFLQSRPLVFLGTVSYGIYLWHEAWIEKYRQWAGVPYRGAYLSDTPFRWHTNAIFSAPWATMVVVTLALTVATAAVSWYAYEKPILRFKGRFDHDRSADTRAPTGPT
jgi:peptidoglycan/LPS O-acetylase OafA/YrhL